MGLSVSAAVAILFIAACIVFGTMINALDEAQGSLIDAQRQSSARTADMESAKIALVSVDREAGTVALLNSGQVTINLTSINVLLNGTLSNERVSSMNVTGHPSTNLWLPDEDLIIELTGSLEMTNIKVVAGNGASAYA